MRNMKHDDTLFWQGIIAVIGLWILFIAIVVRPL